MQKLDRYIFRQISLIFVFFLLVFTMIFWINRAISLFDRLISDGHSASILFQFALLSLPSITTIVFPLACFAAVMFVTHRLKNDSSRFKPMEDDKTLLYLWHFLYANSWVFHNICCTECR